MTYTPLREMYRIKGKRNFTLLLYSDNIVSNGGASS